MENVQIFITAIIGGFIGAYFQAIYQHKKTLLDALHNYKQTRYNAIIIMILLSILIKVLKK